MGSCFNLAISLCVQALSITIEELPLPVQGLVSISCFFSQADARAFCAILAFEKRWVSDPIARDAIMFHCFQSPLSKLMPQRDRVKAPCGCRLPAVVFSWSDASRCSRLKVML